MTRTGQEAAEEASRFHRFNTAQMRERLGGHIAGLQKAGVITEDAMGMQNARTMRQYLEGALQKEFKAGRPAGFTATQQLPKHLDSIQPVLDEMAGITKEYLWREQTLGLGTKRLDDVIEYFPRQLFRFDQEIRPGGFWKTLTAGHKYQRARKEFLERSLLGTELFNTMSLDPIISGTASRSFPSYFAVPAVRKQLENLTAGGGMTVREAKELVRRELPKTSRKDVNLDAAVKHIRDTYGKHLPEHSEQELYDLARFMSELDPQHVASKIPMYGHNPVFDLVQRAEHGERAMQNAEAGYNMLATHARHFRDYQWGDQGVPLRKALMDAELTTGGHNPTVTVEAIDQMFSRLPERLRRLYPDSPFGREAAMDNIRVPVEIAADIGRMHRTFNVPESLQAFVNGYDWFVNYFRGHVTTYFPAFIGRNLLSGQAQNYIGGAYGTNPMNMGRALKDMNTLLSKPNEAVPGVLDIPFIKQAGFTDPVKATRHLANLAFANKLGGRMQAEFAQHLGTQSYAAMGDILGQFPGLHPFGFVGKQSAFAKLIPGRNPARWNPFNIRGVAGTRESQFFLSQWGEDMNFWVESMNRGAPWLSMLRRGWSPSEAARRVKLMQVDYTAVAAGDQAMRRVLPFWAFLKGQTEFLAKELTTRPGGGIAQTIHAEARAQGQLPPFSPPHVQTSAAVPLKPGPSGHPRVMTAFGFMHEDPVQFLAMDPERPLTSIPLNLLREGLSRTAPPIQMGIEEATGRSLYQSGPRGGRATADLDPSLGRLLANISGRQKPVRVGQPTENLVRLTAPRVVSTLKGLTDKRKSIPLRLLHFTTGLRQTDIPPATQEAMQRDAVHMLMRESGAKVFEKPYFPPEQKEKMNPGERKAAEELELLMRILGERAKKRAKLRQLQR